MNGLAVFGAGYVGMRAAEYFKEQGLDVWASARSAAAAEKIKNRGLKPFHIDLDASEPFKSFPEADAALISLAPDQPDEENYRKIYLLGIGKILEAMRKRGTGLKKLIYISSTGVWRDQKDGEVDELTPVTAVSGKSKILIEAERQVLESEIPAAILRLTGIYGPGRNRLKSFREGSWPKENRIMNMIYVDDIAPLAALLLRSGSEGEVYIGTDNAPAEAKEVALWLAGRLGLPAPDLDAPAAGKKYRNDKIKKLGFQPKFPDFRTGYDAILKRESKGVSE